MTKDPMYYCGGLVGFFFEMVAVMFAPIFVFGTEIDRNQIIPEGWLVGVWDGDRWD